MNLKHSLCHFVPEVTKVKGEGLYPGKTLYQLIVAIQKYLHINRIMLRLVDGPEFLGLRNVLDNVMKERTAMNIGVTKRQAAIITYEVEENLWNRGILGEDSPDKLRDTVLFLIGINVTLRAVEEHYQLRRPMPDEPSQFSFECDSQGVRCLVYLEDSTTKTHDGGLNDMRRERKEVWVYPNKNVNRCPVRLTEKYMSLCPNYQKKKNFYLKAKPKTTPKQWYSCQVVGTNSIAKVVKELMKEARIEGFFTNHSLRRTGSTRLFRGGVERKLVKEVTGHRSDAVDSYQITSDMQRQEMSKIIQNKPTATVSVPSDEVTIDISQKSDDNVVKSDAEGTVKCGCKSKNSNVTPSNVGSIIEQILKAQEGHGKTVIKIQIEISNE